MSAQTGSDNEERLTAVLADALFRAFPGLAVFADRVAGEVPAAIVAEDPDAAMVSEATRDRTLGDRVRWTGVRDPLSAGHPVAVKLRADLARAPEAIPEADRNVIEALQELPGFTVADGLARIHGVPIPASVAQIRYFVVLRWRPLFSPLADPARLYRGDLIYDAEHVTDEFQESIMLISTAVYCDQLIRLQTSAPHLFAALWMREFEVAEQFAAATPAARLPKPYERSRLGRHECLMLSASVMTEHERGFELLEALKFVGGVTKTSIKDALKACSSMSGVYAVKDATHEHLASSVAHVRVLNPTMNKAAPRARGDQVFEAMKSGVGQAKLHSTQAQRITKVAGHQPARFFLGVEPVKLLAVELIQIQESVCRHEGEFWLGDRESGGPISGEALGTRLMKLAAIATSNICPQTAAAMLGRPDADLTTELAKRQFIRPLVSNPKLVFKLAEIARAKEDRDLFVPSNTKVRVVHTAQGDKDDFKHPYEQARRRAEKCSPSVGEPGWTRGFRPDAWRQPRAEVNFLRRSCGYVLYDPKLDPKNRAPIQQVQGTRIAGTKVRKPVDLSRKHPVERIHDCFRQQFDRLQVAELVKGHEDSTQAKTREALIGEIALLLPALSPLTDDSNHFERIWADVDAPELREVVEVDWNT